jgi:hypothetical protein
LKRFAASISGDKGKCIPVCLYPVDYQYQSVLFLYNSAGCGPVRLF